VDLYFWRRKKQGKEDLNRFDERLGVPSLARPNSKLVWVHAASVGEAVSALPLIEDMLAGNAWIHVMVTTGTVTSAYLMQQRLPKRSFHQYAPIDKLEYVQEFIDYWQPDLAIWVESEFWPNMILETKRVGCPMVLLNGRISDESFDKWQRYKKLLKMVLACFDLVLPQSREDSAKLRGLGARNIKYLGNLKYGARPLPCDEKKLAEVQQMVGGRMVWLAASTHPGEEEEILQAHLRIKEKNYQVLTIIVPRHPIRGAEVRDLCAPYANVAMRSNNEKILEDTDIYIADTLGELGLFYRVAPIVFIGGSLVERGGHNPIEPAHLDAAIICGPHMENFAEIVHEFESAGALAYTTDAKDLAYKVFELWQNPQKRTAMSRMASRYVRSKQEVLGNIIDEIEALM
jgi:3-deoxy-D-manno-octulosonic-acid transferase